MRKKGFTLVELMSVIVVLGLIALIMVPVVVNVIGDSKKKAFKAKVEVAYENLKKYAIDYDYTPISTTGITVEDLKKIADNDFTGGKFIEIDNKVQAWYITDGKYCAKGTMRDLEINKNCQKLDNTPAIVDESKINLSSTESSISVTLNSGYAIDEESGISRVIISVTGAGKTTTKTVTTEGEHVIDKLKHNTNYTVLIQIINGNEISTDLTYNITTNDISIPQIILDTEDWSQSKTATIDYPIKDGYHKEYSLDDGITWNTYNEPIVFTSNGSIIARFSDSDRINVVVSSAKTVELIDNTKPTCGTWSGEATSSTDWSQSRTIQVTCQDNGECAKESYSEITNSGITTTKNVTIEIYDKAGNHTTCTKEDAMVYVDTVAPTCGTWSGENSSWKNSGTVTVNVACADEGSGCSQSSYQAYTVSSGNISTKAVSVNIYDKAGNSTPCSKTANIYLDTSTYTASFNGNGGGNGTAKTSKFGVALGTLPSSSRACYSFGGWFTAASGGSQIGTGTTMPRGGATYYAHWSVSNGWSGTSYCNGGSKKTSAYVAENLDNTHYFWINASGTRSSVRYAWYKGSKGWWFHNVNDEAAYEKSVTRAICKRNSNSSLTCKNYSFDSSGWCSSDNYACN